MLRILLLLGFLAVTSGLNAAVILQYHHVSVDTPASTSISPELFAEHMAYVDELGYEVVSLSQLVASIRSGESLDDNLVVITFDDGYDDIIKPIKDEVVSRGWPFTIFVPPQLIEIGASGYMSWDQLLEMQRLGGEIANHSWDHGHLAGPQLGETAAQWELRIKDEIDRAEAMLEQRTGESLKLFAFPFGEFSHELLALLESEGYAGVGQQSGAVGLYSDITHLPRFPFGGHYGAMEDFATKVRSLAMPIKSYDLLVDEKPLSSNLLRYGSAWPTLQITLRDDTTINPERIECFVSLLGRQTVKVVGEKQIQVSVDGPLKVGRSRYNCTSPSTMPGRFYWYSVPLVMRAANGTFVD